MTLKLISRTASGKSITVQAFPFVLGSARGCDYRLSDEGVSGVHACIVERKGRFYVVDLKSKNGTHVIHSKEGCSPVVTNAFTVESPDEISSRHLVPGVELINGAVVAFAASLFSCAIESHPVEDSCALPGDKTVEHPADDCAGSDYNITITRGEESGRVIQLTEFPIIFGSGQSHADIIFPNVACVSRKHAKIDRLTDGEVVLEDIQSRNGTFLNKRRITTPAKLNDGDKVELAREVEFIFHAAKTKAAPAALKSGRLFKILGLSVLTTVLTIALAVFLNRQGLNPEVKNKSISPALSSTVQKAADDDSAAPNPLDNKENYNNNVAMVVDVKDLLMSKKGWDINELQRAKSMLTAIADGNKLIAPDLDTINSRLVGIKQMEDAHVLIVRGDYQGALSLIDQALNSFGENGNIMEMISSGNYQGASSLINLSADAPGRNAGAIYSKAGVMLLIKLKGLLAASATSGVDCRQIGVHVSGARNAFCGKEDLPRFFQEQVDRIATPIMDDIEKDVATFRDRGEYLECLTRVHDGLSIAPDNQICNDTLLQIEPLARKSLTEMVKKAYLLENESSPKCQAEAREIFAEIRRATAPNNWTDEFYSIAAQRNRD